MCPAPRGRTELLKSRGEDVAGSRQRTVLGAAKLSLVAASAPQAVCLGVLLWLGRKEMEASVVSVAQGCSFLRLGR